MLIDFHTHCFPDKIAPRAIERLSFVSGGLVPLTDGTKDGLISSMEKTGTNISVVLNIATNAHQEKSVNDFAISLNGKDGIVSFGSVFPFSENALSEIDRLANAGIKGIKLHPDYQGFFVDDERVFPIYKKISERGLITVFHAGRDFGYPPPYKATPERLKRALSHFSSPVVAAHLGGLGFEEEVLSTLCGLDIYFDTAFSFGQLPRYYSEKIIKSHGADRILFGSDSPWHTPDMEMELIRNLSLSDSEAEKITHENAEKLLEIK